MTEETKDVQLTPEQLKRSELIEKLNNGENLTDEEIDQLKYFNKKEEVQKIDRVIRGVNDIFSKHYDFEKEWGVTFDISIKAPNAIEQGTIQARREAYLQGMGMAVSPYQFQVYHTLATIRTCGVVIPKILEKDEDIYNLNILYAIGQDFGDWLSTFRL